MAGRTGTARLPDEPGGRRHRNNAVPDGRAGNHLGRGGGIDGLDGEVWRATGTLHGLEKRLCARAHGQGTAARQTRPDAVWTDVRAVGYQDHRSRIAPGQGPGGAQPWNASGPAGEEAAAQAHYYE